MNRDERKGMRERAANRLKKSKAYVVLCFDGKGEPVFSFDMGPCANKGDLRHVMMHNAADFIVMQASNLREKVQKNIAQAGMAEKVSEYKRKRSEELSKVG